MTCITGVCSKIPWLLYCGSQLFEFYRNSTDYRMMRNLQSVTKRVKLSLAPSAFLFKVSFTFACSFLATTAWYSFSRLGTTLKQGEVEAHLWASLTFLELFHKNMVSLNNFCDCLSQHWSVWLLIESWRSIWQTFC